MRKRRREVGTRKKDEREGRRRRGRKNDEGERRRTKGREKGM